MPTNEELSISQKARNGAGRKPRAPKDTGSNGDGENHLPCDEDARQVTYERPAYVRIRARIDVGAGNFLTVYGNWKDAAGWKTGLPMLCILPDLWELVVPVTNLDVKLIEFKTKLNDVVWEACGINHAGYPDSQVEFTPRFDS